MAQSSRFDGNRPARGLSTVFVVVTSLISSIPEHILDHRAKAIRLLIPCTACFGDIAWRAVRPALSRKEYSPPTHLRSTCHEIGHEHVSILLGNALETVLRLEIVIKAERPVDHMKMAWFCDGQQ